MLNALLIGQFQSFLPVIVFGRSKVSSAKVIHTGLVVLAHSPHKALATVVVPLHLGIVHQYF